MLRQIKYFQAVVRNNSFSEAAEECHISQSAVSQQIKALENELGFQLLERKNRRFALTPAGEHFYKKSLILVADYEQICNESARIARGDEAILTIGYLWGYSSQEMQFALEEFSTKYPRVSVQLLQGNHEELFSLLRNGSADLVLAASRMYIEISSRSGTGILSDGHWLSGRFSFRGESGRSTPACDQWTGISIGCGK